MVMVKMMGVIMIIRVGVVMIINVMAMIKMKMIDNYFTYNVTESDDTEFIVNVIVVIMMRIRARRSGDDDN